MKMQPRYGVPPEHDGSGIVNGCCVVCDVPCADQGKDHPACAISLGEVEEAYAEWRYRNRYVLAFNEAHHEVNLVLAGATEGSESDDSGG